VSDRGDSSAFAAFYRANYSLVLTTCERRLSDRRLAEDATAEVFRIAWERARVGHELSIAWVYGVVRNVVGNEYRRARRIEVPLEEDGRWHGAADFGLADRALEVRAALAQLRPADRELLFMAYWEDLSPIEMAQILTCSLPNLWVRLNRARKALRRKLGSFEQLEVSAAG
jgi:RNA polymerase sigma-70 factor (ECF subfamily)